MIFDSWRGIHLQELREDWERARQQRSLVNRDSATTWARRLNVQFDVDKCCSTCGASTAYRVQSSVPLLPSAETVALAFEVLRLACAVQIIFPWIKIKGKFLRRNKHTVRELVFPTPALEFF